MGAAPITMPIDRGIFDPPVEVTRIRERAPLCRLRYPDGHVGWLVTGYELARTVLSDARFSMHPMRSPVEDPERQKTMLVHRMRSDQRFAEVFDRYAGNGRAPHEALADPELLYAVRSDPPSCLTLIELDPETHNRLRRMLAGYFTVRRVDAHREMVERIVAGRLDVMQRSGPPVDLVEAFTLPIPSLVICALLGAPPAERDRFHQPVMIMKDPQATLEEKMAASSAFRDFAHEQIRHKRTHPADDLLSELARDGELTNDQLASVAVQLFDAGHETTADMLSLAVLTLLHDRAYWDALCADPTLVGTAVEELLRFVTLVQVGAFTRTAVQDLGLGAETIRAGESVTVSLAAANRDPDRFADPDRLDFARRDVTGHLAFGHGIHQCLGQHLARLEMQIAISALGCRFPGLRLAVPVDEVPLYPGDRFTYGLQRLPVTW
jgi:cytochrome P450